MERVRDKDVKAGSEATGGAISVDRDQSGELSEQICRADLLRYIGDMTEELQSMCESTGCSTLAGLLALARAEAMLQQDYNLRRRAR